MPNMNPKKCPMPEQAPDVRNKNFEEVTLGYTAEMAVEEAQRCLNCKNKPCMTGCPVQVKIPEFIALVAEGKFLEAAAKIKETSALPAVCGRVCPQESQCECHCVRGIKGEAVAIGRLERFAADYARENSTEKAVKPESNGHKVAIVGAGPAGLTCAGDLARMGYEVTVFEALHTAGGVLMYGIPEFRLPKAIVQKEIDTLKDLGVEFVLNFVVGRSETIDELFGDGFEAIFVGSGAGLPTMAQRRRSSRVFSSAAGTGIWGMDDPPVAQGQEHHCAEGSGRQDCRLRGHRAFRGTGPQHHAVQRCRSEQREHG